jgi:hypothetical protein
MRNSLSYVTKFLPFSPLLGVYEFSRQHSLRYKSRKNNKKSNFSFSFSLPTCLQVFLNFSSIIGAPTKADNAGQPSLNVHNLQKLEHAPTLLSTSPTPNAYRIPLIRTPTCLSPNNQLTQHTRQREAPISAGIWVLFHKCVPHHTLSQSGLLYYWMD